MHTRVGALALAAAGLMACGGDDGNGNGNGSGNGNGAIPPEVAAILALDGDAAAGESEFGQSCGEANFCHGQDGVSGPGGNLATIVPASTDVELVTVMIEGAGGGAMPSQASLGDQTLADILAYLRAEFR